MFLVFCPQMHKRYTKDGCPSEFPVRSKCIALFQTIDGVDVILFAMYVYEYDDSCPAPNRRRVYVSYLDSVNYFRPKQYRTIAYHALIVEYLRYVKERGFHTAHVWSCPPSDGDDYVFHSHPREQLVPREDMLRQWYYRMLEKAEEEGIVLETLNLYDVYFNNNGTDAPLGSAASPTCLPYFEGDYIPGEIENIIKYIGTENDATDLERLEDSLQGNQDKAMLRLGQALYNMRQNFMVVRLRSKDFVEAVEKGDDVTGWIDEDGDAYSSKRIKIGSKDSNCLSQLPSQQQRILVEMSRCTDTTTDSAKGHDTAIENKVEQGACAVFASGASGGGSVQDPQNHPLTAIDSGSYPASDAPHEAVKTPAVASPKDGNGESFKSYAASPVPNVSIEVKEQVKETDATPALPTEVKEKTVEMIQASSEDSEPPQESRTKSSAEQLEESKDDGSSTPETVGQDGVVSGYLDFKVALQRHEKANGVPPFKSGDTSEQPSEKVVDTSSENHTVREESTPPAASLKHEQDSSKAPSSEKSREIPAKCSKRSVGEIEPTVARHFASARSNATGTPVGTTADEDQPQETEMFESRQQFLNYCQANHFQFDDLRRAKHSTMMILFQLHNPTAPMFLQQCGACYRDITHGTRYHCNNCSNFDLCQDCYEPVTTGLWAKRDSRFTHNKRHTFVAIDMEAPADTQKSRDERSRTIKLHLELVSHAATCDGPPGCSLNNCQRMKKLFKHVESCEVTYRNGCKICSRLLSLLTIHARMCTVRGSCPLPFCDRIRERNRRRKQQQQLMDDRRREAQNELYRRGAPD